MDKRASEVLWDQLPIYFRPVMEFQEIVKAHGHGVDQVNAWMIRMRDNFYIASCDEQTLMYYEKLLGINKNRSLSLEERRSIVLMRYNRRSLYTLPMLKGMLEAAVGKGHYSVNCSYGSYQMKITIIEQDTELVRELYNTIALMNPAHLILLLCAEYQGRHEISIEQKAAVHFAMSFYPRFNQERLKLNRIWKLNGGRKLNGYNSRETIDLYPMSARFRTAAEGTLEEEVRVHLLAGAGEKEWVRSQAVILIRESTDCSSGADQRVAIKTQAAEAWGEETQVRLRAYAQERVEDGERLQISSSVACKTAIGERQAVRTSAAVTVEAGEIRVYNKNRLDSGFRLNGRRKLNGGTELR